MRADNIRSRYRNFSCVTRLLFPNVLGRHDKHIGNSVHVFSLFAVKNAIPVNSIKSIWLIEKSIIIDYSQRICLSIFIDLSIQLVNLYRFLSIEQARLY